MVVSALVWTACGGEGPAPKTLEEPEPHQVEGRLFEESMELENGDTLVYDRGVVQAPVRRAAGSDDPSGLANPDVATLELEFFRLRRQTSADSDVPPIFLLRGGPGFEGLGPLLGRPGYYENLLERHTRVSDLVVVGQRGFGTSHATPCEPAGPLTAQEALDDEVYGQAMKEARAACRRHWEEQGLDLGGFTVLEAADDVIDVADFLGYDRIQLWGVSFGSHWGMTILRRHAERVARATFGGLEGPDHTYDMPSGVLAAMEGYATSAEGDPSLSLPSEGLLKAYSETIRRLDQQPLSLSVDLDPEQLDGLETAETVQLELTGAHLRELLADSRRYTSFRFRSRGWPEALHSVIQGGFEGAVAALVESRLELYLPDAAFYMLDCSSGLSRARGEILRNDPAAAMLGPIWLGYDEGCAAWDADLGEAFREPFESSVPTVLVQGNWDTSTPYENAVEARKFFDHHHFVHVEGGSHGALREALKEVEGFEEAILKWLETGDFQGLPESVELPPMVWTEDSDS